MGLRQLIDRSAVVRSAEDAQETHLGPCFPGFEVLPASRILVDDYIATDREVADVCAELASATPRQHVPNKSRRHTQRTCSLPT